MKTAMKGVWPCTALAAALWFVMFSPWTAPHVNFWGFMTCSALLLAALASVFRPGWFKEIRIDFKGICTGILLAAFLWCIFWVGDKVSQWIFSFARADVDLIYGMKEGADPTVIALLLFFIIGPAEEIFWRAFVQRNMMDRWGAWKGWIVTTCIYAAVHIWSFNFMLVAAAFVIGALWGLFYRLWPQKLFPLILSHALWDAFAFVILPF